MFKKDARSLHRVAVIAALGLLLGACSDGGGEKISLSGSLSVPSFVVTDSDLNDANSNPVSNNDGARAQAVPNPVNIGGYVTERRSGQVGRLFESGDELDFYRVDLVAGQNIQLTIADPARADLDLYLFDENEQVVDFSDGFRQYESLQVQADGRYYVAVLAYEGGSNYLLSIGLTPTLPAAVTEASAGFRLSDDFVPGQVLARFKPQNGSINAFNSRLQTMGLNPVAGHASSLKLLEVDSSALFAANAASGTAPPRIPLALVQRMGDKTALQKLTTLYAVKALMASGLVDYAEVNGIRKASQTVPNDPFYPQQWHYPLMALPQAWDISTGSSDVVVAVIDTGVLLDHPDLQGKLVQGYDFISDPRIAADGDGIDDNPDDPGDGGLFSGSSFHGTHVAGTIGAASNNNLGVAGVAWGSKIMPLRVLGVGGGTDYDIAQAVRFAAGLSNDSGTLPAQSAAVINLSLGGYVFNQSLADAIGAARAAGSIVVAAAGNENTSRLSYPAAFPGVVGVSAVDIERQRAPYSNFGSYIDIAAPGGNTSRDVNGDGRPDGVLSTLADQSFGSIVYNLGYYQGTSMAAPHVAGVAALMKSVYPDLTPADFDAQLASGNLSVDLGDAGRDNLFGHGLINAYQSLLTASQLAGGTLSSTAVLSITPQALNLGAAQTSATLFIEKAGSGELSGVSISNGEGWLNIAPLAIDADGLGSFRVSVNRSGLAQGTYTANVTVTSTVSTAGFSVIMQVANQVSGGDAGTQYVLLVDAESFEVVAQDSVDTANGGGGFRFGEVAPGNYLLIAGSDMDNDSVICDAGEACGAWPTGAQPVAISYTGSRLADLDFLSSYPSETPTSQGAKLAEDAPETNSLAIRRLK